MTARYLGPSGKGMLATLMLLVLVFGHLGGAGFGEAAIVEAGRGRMPLQEVLRATIAAVIVTSTIASITLLLVGTLVFTDNLHTAAPALVISLVGLGPTVWFPVLSQVLNASQRLVLTSALYMFGSFVTLTGTAIFLILLDLGLAGAVLASSVAALAGVTAAGIALTRVGFSLRPRWNTAYVRRALKFGSIVQSAYLLGALAGRLDLLLVYAIASNADAGYYSIALTIGALCGYVPWAVSYASFPRLAALDEDASHALMLHACRLGLAAAIISGIALFIIAPVMIPATLGDAFQPAIVPALIMVPGGVVISAQVLYCRALAARGEARPLLLTFMVSLIVMVVADLALIPLFGMTGAATVATIAPAIGLWAAVMRSHRYAGPHVKFSQLIPRLVHFRLVLAQPRQLVRRFAPATRSPTNS